jgi:hypothetical protein
VTNDAISGEPSGLSRPGFAPAPLALAAVAGAVALLLALAGVSMVLLLGGVSGSPSDTGQYGVSADAVRDIPAAYLRLYMAAAARYGLDWSVLAAIGKIECDHGRDPDPSCTVQGATNFAGAGGPAQFLASTWRQYGVDADGQGPPNRWDPTDAIFAMARLLKAAGAPGDYERAIFAYNHADWYVDEVEQWAAMYRGAATAQLAPGAGGDFRSFTGPLTSGEIAVLAPGDGHLALAPADAPAAVKAMIAAGNELQELPYGAAGHPDPVGAASEDCSSSVSFVLYGGAVRSLTEIIASNPLAQSYVDWGLPGPGRWVTIYATTAPTPHVFIVIAGLRLDTSHRGTDVGPNRDQDGPRWRIFDEIPTWANWSVRHPPGL